MTPNPIGAQTQGDRSRAASARRLVRDQHLELRRLLAIGIVEADRLVDGRSILHQPLRSLVDTIGDVLVRHLADEEALIPTILAEDPAPWRVRMSALREDHARQRAEIEALCAWPVGAGDVELALRFDRLARSLLRDIADEEQLLLVPAIRTAAA